MNGTWRFRTTSEIVFGRGAAQQIGDIVHQLKAQRVLLVTDQGLIAAGLHEDIERSLSEVGIETDRFDGGSAKATLGRVEACKQAAEDRNYDALIALGGGSNVDTAKTVAVLLRYGGVAEDYFGEDKVPGPSTPLIAVSTTAGTGSEVTASAILSDPDNQRRAAIISPYIRPKVAIYDPLLTVSCPPKLTADAGIDALTQAIESYMVINYHSEITGYSPSSGYQGMYPLVEMMAEQAIELSGKFLRGAVHQGNNLEAREGMHYAAMLAGMAFSNAGLNAVHALEYPVGVHTGHTHGAIVGLLLPYVMAYNLPACTNQLAKVAELLGEAVTGLSAWDAAQKSVDSVQHLKADIGIPMRLRELGVEKSDLASFAETASKLTRLTQLNPRPLDLEGLGQILQNAW